jgi:hypothetical protein
VYLWHTYEYVPRAAWFAHRRAGSATAVVPRTHSCTNDAVGIHGIVPRDTPFTETIILCMCFLCLYMYIFVYTFMCATLSRVIGITAHPGAVATVPHRCPALIRAVSTMAHPGAVATVPHRCPALIRAVDTTGHGRQESPPAGTPDRHATGRGYARRTGTLRALLADRGKR